MRQLSSSLLIAAGMLCVALGAIGMFLPVLPTVPFLLLALWCFTRSSERFHGWLSHHRLFGPPLQQWEQHRVIPIRAKLIAITSMVFSAIYVVFYTNSSIYLIILMCSLMGCGVWFILSNPSRMKEK